MKKLFTTLLLAVSCCLLANNVHSALPTNIEWVVRSDGDDANGGCAQEGASTDYSDQASAQLSLTDLAMTTGGTTLTSSTGGFTAAMVDNCIQISSGTNFTAGFYEITGHTDTNTVTIDRDATNGSNASGGSGKVGGSLATIGKAINNHVGGSDIYVKKGTYGETVTLGDSQGGSGNNNFRLIGYNASKGDNPVGSDRPTIDCASTRANGLDTLEDDTYVHHFIIKDCTSHCVDHGGVSSGTTVLFDNVRFTNCGGDGVRDRQVLKFIGCEFDNNSAHGYANDTYGGALVAYSYSHDNTDSGFSANNGSTFIHNISDTNGDGFTASSNVSLELFNNVSYNSGTNYQLGQSTTTDDIGIIVVNNVCQDGSKCYYRLSSAYTEPFWIYNQYNGATNSNMSVYERGNITSNVSFTDAANGDFSISSASPVIGQALVPPGTSTTLNMGVDQTQAGGGSGGETSHTFTY